MEYCLGLFDWVFVNGAFFNVVCVFFGRVGFILEVLGATAVFVAELDLTREQMGIQGIRTRERIDTSHPRSTWSFSTEATCMIDANLID
jgi:hypothetical protein